MVNRVLEYRRERRSVEEIKERVPEFAEEYKHLFEMITAPEGFDQKNLDLMLSMLGFMGQGRLSQHEASVLVGKRLFEKYGGSFK
jgi:DNA-binding ferritin-like protein (Dps family)